MKKIFIFFFVACFLFSFISVIGFAEEASTEATTEEVTEVTTIEETEPPTDETSLSDINNSLHFVIFGLFVIVGCLVAQAFSFWKW